MFRTLTSYVEGRATVYWDDPTHSELWEGWSDSTLVCGGWRGEVVESGFIKKRLREVLLPKNLSTLFNRSSGKLFTCGTCRSGDCNHNLEVKYYRVVKSTLEVIWKDNETIVDRLWIDDTC